MAGVGRHGIWVSRGPVCRAGPARKRDRQRPRSCQFKRLEPGHRRGPRARFRITRLNRQARPRLKWEERIAGCASLVLRPAGVPKEPTARDPRTDPKKSAAGP